MKFCETLTAAVSFIEQGKCEGGSSGCDRPGVFGD